MYLSTIFSNLVLSTKQHTENINLYAVFIFDKQVHILFLVYNPAHGEMYSIQHYVIKFVIDLRQVVGFLRVLRFPPPIKLTATT